MSTTHASALTPAVIQEHGITPEEYQRIKSALGRDPSLTELGIFSVMWSEHCSYKSSRVHLKRLPTRSKVVVQGPGENAGIIDIGDGWACAFKIESHNHPSFIEPFQGAATGVGGILRDIFTMGARPLAVMDSLRFGPPIRTQFIVTIPSWRAWSAGLLRTEIVLAFPISAVKPSLSLATRRILWSTPLLWDWCGATRSSTPRPRVREIR